MLKLYYTYLDNLPAVTDDICLSEYRRQKLEKIKNDGHRKQSLAAELLLNKAISLNYPQAELPLDISAGSKGKPMLTDIPLHFNLSHSGNVVVCAVSDNEVGVDVQVLEYRPNVAARFFTEDEEDYISRQTDKPKTFTRIWTMKESYLKYLGTGLELALSSFSVLELNCEFSCFELENFEVSLCSYAKQNNIEPEYIELG